MILVLLQHQTWPIHGHRGPGLALRPELKGPGLWPGPKAMGRAGPWALGQALALRTAQGPPSDQKTIFKLEDYLHLLQYTSL